MSEFDFEDIGGYYADKDFKAKEKDAKAKAKKKTNADRIRNMTDEELVDAWYYVKDDVIPRGINTRQDILNWLGKGVTNEQNN